jgi:hypothetical protein
MLTLGHISKAQLTFKETLIWKLFEDEIACSLGGIPATGRLAMWTELNLRIDASAVLTVIVSIKTMLHTFSNTDF